RWGWSGLRRCWGVTRRGVSRRSHALPDARGSRVTIAPSWRQRSRCWDPASRLNGENHRRHASPRLALSMFASSSAAHAADKRLCCFGRLLAACSWLVAAVEIFLRALLGLSVLNALRSRLAVFESGARTFLTRFFLSAAQVPAAT